MVSIGPYEEEPFPPLCSAMEDELGVISAHARLFEVMGRALDKTYCSGTARKSFGLKPFAVTEDSMWEASSELEAWTEHSPWLTTPIENMRR